MLWDGGNHSHGHDHGDHHHHGGQHDTNIRAAFVHVLADAVTSVLAIIALLGGRYYGLTWLDAAMGIVGAVIILRWSYGLVLSSGKTLLDIVPDNGPADRIRSRLEIKGDRVADLHLWRLGPGHAGMIASMVSDNPQGAGYSLQAPSRWHRGPVAHYHRGPPLPRS